VNKPRTIEGQWWIDGDDKLSHFGILSFDPEKGLDLSVKIPQQRDDEGWIRLLQADSENKHLLKTIPEVIHGADEGNRSISVFGLGSFGKNAASGLDTHRFGSIQAAILNYHGQSLDEERFSIASVHYTLLTKWMGRLLHLDSCKADSENEDHHLSIKFKSHEIFEYDVKQGIRLRIEGNTLRERSQDELRLEWRHNVWFLFPKSVSPRAIIDEYAFVFLRLLCLLTGERVFIEELFFWNDDPFKPKPEQFPQGSELLISNPGITDAKKDTIAPFMIATFKEIEAEFGSILKRWFECHEQLKPVLDLYFAVLSGLVLTTESQFLLLAQALEVYHARSTKFDSREKPEPEHELRVKTILECVRTTKYQSWLESKLVFSNQKALPQRIADILKLYKIESARLTAKVDDFATKVLDSRNYYTHYSQKILKRGKVASGLELRRIEYALLYLLQICFLKELGVEGKPIERILKRNDSIEWADLKAEAKS
jgi:hypothetical protein